MCSDLPTEPTYPDTSPPLDDIKELLFEALEVFEAEGAAGLQRFLSAHSTAADELRARLAELRAAGLLGGGREERLDD